MFSFNTPWKQKKIEDFWRLQGVLNGNIGHKWVNLHKLGSWFGPCQISMIFAKIVKYVSAF